MDNLLAAEEAEWGEYKLKYGITEFIGTGPLERTWTIIEKSKEDIDYSESPVSSEDR